MNFIQLSYLLTGSVISILLALFTLSSISERRLRAAAIAASLLVAGVVVWFGGYYLLHPSDGVIAVILLAVLVPVLFFFVPLGSRTMLEIGDITSRVDERDTVFARKEYCDGTDKHRVYYAMRPENVEIDNRMRKLPVLLEQGGRYYDVVRSADVRSVFDEIEELTVEVDGDVSSERTPVDPIQATEQIKTMVKRLGADDVGVARLNPMFVYSHVGRGPEQWGEPVRNEHRYAIMFTLEMDFRCVEAAPDLPITEETARRYLKAAEVSIDVARHIRSMGYPARAHISGSNYQIMLPPVAHDAGLGELGRLGYLISPRLGARIRLGAITTDLPLTPDRPCFFGVQDFCEKCKKCAVNCPSGAIPDGEPVEVLGVRKWPLNVEQCIRYWRVIGTDCGLCMRVCPFSHPPTLVHNLVRAGVKRSSFARSLASYGDDLLYGKTVEYYRPPV